MVRARRFVAGVVGGAALAAALSGCGGAGAALAAPEPAPSAAASAAPEATPADPKAAARAAVEAAAQSLRTAGSGNLLTNSTTAVPGLWISRKNSTYFDLRRDRWRADATLRQMVDGPMQTVSMSMVGSASRLFMSISAITPTPKGAAKDFGHWMRLDGMPLNTTDDASGLAVLEAFTVYSIEPRSNGGSIVVGRIPTAAAAGMLGFNKAILAAGEKRFAGTTRAELYLDAEGRPVRLDLDGAGARFTAKRKPPVEVRQLIAASTATVTFRMVGMPVEVTIPADAVRITDVGTGIDLV